MSASTNPVIVTGATAGLGRKTAVQLARAGIPVIVGGRSRPAIDTVIREIETVSDTPATRFEADLADLRSIEANVSDLPELGGFVANAGISIADHRTSEQGAELTYAVNVLSHQLIAAAVSDRLEDGARVVFVSSGVHDPDNKLARRAGVPSPRWVGAEAAAFPHRAPGNLFIENTRQRYSNSKLANIYQARELQRRLREAGREVDVFAIDPGLMVDTQFARDYPRPLQLILRSIGSVATPLVDNMRFSSTSARHVAQLITAPGLRGFQYFDGQKPRPPAEDAQRDDLAIDMWEDNAQIISRLVA